MAENHAAAIASYLFKFFNSESIIPLQAVAGLLKLIPGLSNDSIADILKEWKKMGEDALQQNSSQNKVTVRDISAPLILTRGAGSAEDGESLKFYFPEEKILINKSIFHKKIENADFTRMNPQIEKKLLEELRTEAIGLTDQEVFIYYSLLRFDALSRLADRPVSAGLDPDEVIVSSDVTIVGQGPFRYAEKIMEIIEHSFLSVEKLAMVNERKIPEKEFLIEAFGSKISKSIYNPRVYCLMCGYEIDRYSIFIKEYLKIIASRWGGDYEEILSYFVLYQLLNSAKPETLESMHLSVSLKNFANDNLGRIHPVFYCAILFISVFTYILIMQVMEISGRYFSIKENQREKLRKLYDSDERINMLVNNAFNIASGKITHFKAESREIISSMKKYLTKNKNIIQPSDMFMTRYNF